MKNRFIIGLADKTASLDTKPGFLLIDDGPIADAFLERFSRAKEFDPHTHTFNSLPMNDRHAKEFAKIVFEDAGGKDTLTTRRGKSALRRLVKKAKGLDQLGAGKSDDEKEAKAVVDDLLESPLLRNVLCGTDNKFSFRGGRSSVVARLDRAEIGEDDAKILAWLLIFQFKGQIIIPDFGFYARPFHSSLIRENRLIAGVNTLSELDQKMRDRCMLMPKVGSQCLHEDAVEIAKFDCRFPPTTNEYNSFIHESIKAV